MAYTTISDSSAHFQNKIYTGDGNDNRAITNDGNSNLRPDWIWFKNRDTSNSHNLLDSRRGITKKLEGTNNTNAEGTTSTRLTSFDTDGFTVRTDPSVNGNGNKIVAWQWAAGGAAPTQTYKVVVVSDSGNKYRFRNSADNATYAASAVTLDLQEGGTYTFDVSDNTVDSHPFVIGTSANSNEYSTGVVYKLDGVTKTYSQYTSGFSAATTRQLIITVAASAPTLYYWCSQHSGMGGQINTNSEFGSTNFDGSILSIVTANTTAGFSIATWTGNGTAGATIGHGLGAVPHMMIVKKRSGTDSWPVYHHKLTSAPETDYLHLDSNGQTTDSVDRWNDTAPTSTVASLGDAGAVNGGSATYVGYFFTSIKGYSSFGSYQGTGDSNGTYVYTGFKPTWFLVKGYDVTQNWQMWDSKRNSSTPVPEIGNPRIRTLSASVANSETGDYEVDFCSTGVKIRNNDAAWNGDSNNYIYMCFAECPLVAGGVVSTGG